MESPVPVAGDNDYVFLDFPVTERATNIDAEVNEKKHIMYKTYKTTLAKWMPGYVGVENAEEFLKRFGTTESLRSLSMREYRGKMCRRMEDGGRTRWIGM